MPSCLTESVHIVTPRCSRQNQDMDERAVIADLVKEAAGAYTTAASAVSLCSEPGVSIHDILFIAGSNCSRRSREEPAFQRRQDSRMHLRRSRHCWYVCRLSELSSIPSLVLKKSSVRSCKTPHRNTFEAASVCETFCLQVIHVSMHPWTMLQRRRCATISATLAIRSLQTCQET